MRARTFVFALVLGTATAALAQDGGYVRFISPSPQACAIACAGDQMCASWSFGTGARSYGQNQTRSEGAGMCTFSGSSAIRNSVGTVSGLPRRESVSAPVPMMSTPPQPVAQSAPQQGYRSAPQGTSGGSGWDVRPAPWLSGAGGQAPAQPQGYPAQRGQPQQIARDVPPIPSATPSAAPRIEYDPQPSQASPPYARPPMMQAPAPTPMPAPAPIYVPPVPAYSPPAPVYAPAPAPYRAAPPPPRTEEIPQSMDPEAMAAPATRRPAPARGVPRNRTPAPQAAPAVALPPEDNGSTASMDLPTRAPAAAPPSAAPPRRAAPARGSPRTSATAPLAAGPAAAAPPRQETAARPTSGRGAPRPPVRDPSNPESFRGADGMIDAAEMRRAQLNAAREQGTPAYSVQREWEAVAAERQRAEDAGEVRVDPLAGTSPVAPPPETRAERRAREAEETAAAAEEASAAARANGDDPEEAAPAPARRTPSRGARGTPRPKAAPRQTSQNGDSQQVAESRSQSSRRAPPQALDREPRLSGGPG
jgi:hypothetical protein